MKVFDVDISAKYIFLKLKSEEAEYIVQFRTSLRKGVYDIVVWDEHGKTADVKVTGAYPPLKKWIPEVWRIWIPVWWKRTVRKFRRLHNR